jgi:hypothetical protein
MYHVAPKKPHLSSSRGTVSANDPRVEFRPSRKLRQQLDGLRRELKVKLKKPVSMSRLVGTILEQFFEKSQQDKR